jgi:hypothetical protein
MSIIANFSEIRNYGVFSGNQNLQPVSYTNQAPAFTSDNFQKNIPATNSLPASTMFFTNHQAAGPESFELKPSLSEAIKEGAKIKGIAFGLQYLIAGMAVGMGVTSSIVNFVPKFAVNAPEFFGCTSTFAKTAITGLTAGAVGTAIGAAKGAVDGTIVTYAPNRGIAMAAVAVTSGLSNLPLLKVGTGFGLAGIGISGAAGAYYGGFLYDDSRNPEKTGF